MPYMKAPKTKVIVIDRQAPAQPAQIIMERQSDDCCKWCPGLFGLLGLLGLLCCLLFHINKPKPTPIVPPVVTPQPVIPPSIVPDTLEPIPVLPPVIPVKPWDIDPIKANPIGIKDCDKTVIGSIVDPTVGNAVGVNRPVTYMEPHSMDPVSTNPTAVGPSVVENVTAGTVTQPDTVNPYITSPIVTVLNGSAISTTGSSGSAVSTSGSSGASTIEPKRYVNGARAKHKLSLSI